MTAAPRELHVPAGTASIIVAATPLVSVTVARVLFHETVTVYTVIGSAIALGGVVIVCLARASVSLSASVWIVIGAMVVQGIYHPLQKPLLREHTGIEVATYTMVAGAVLTLPIAPFGWRQAAAAPPSAWLAAAYLRLLPLGELPVPEELLGGVVVIAGVLVVSQGARIFARVRRPAFIVKE